MKVFTALLTLAAITVTCTNSAGAAAVSEDGTILYRVSYGAEKGKTHTDWWNMSGDGSHAAKLDLPDARATFEELRETIPGLRGISAATGEGVQELVYATWETIRTTPVPELTKPEPAQIQLVADEPFEIRVEAGTYIVSGARVERLAQMTDFDSDEALVRFEQILTAGNIRAASGGSPSRAIFRAAARPVSVTTS